MACSLISLALAGLLAYFLGWLSSYRKHTRLFNTWKRPFNYYWVVWGFGRVSKDPQVLTLPGTTQYLNCLTNHRSMLQQAGRTWRTDSLARQGEGFTTPINTSGLKGNYPLVLARSPRCQPIRPSKPISMGQSVPISTNQSRSPCSSRS